ncbi:hypothetical protein BC937DRAFT_93479 [Endogone sp. FLAS-F59071]|nr:hypothetical protein BC937DRAFT_93479 [Endogone sp. FLAS-F59071]|eukprot:RUS14686.1 hypothetical protein BC937DRAFT_93479 [Endogone sp. FLAS-F59071]
MNSPILQQSIEVLTSSSREGRCRYIACMLCMLQGDLEIREESGSVTRVTNVGCGTISYGNFRSQIKWFLALLGYLNTLTGNIL